MKDMLISELIKICKSHEGKCRECEINEPEEEDDFYCPVYDAPWQPMFWNLQNDV